MLNRLHDAHERLVEQKKELTMKNMTVCLLGWMLVLTMSGQVWAKTIYVNHNGVGIPIMIIPVPQNLTATEAFPYAADISWNSVADADRYELEWHNPDTSLWEPAYDGPYSFVHAEPLEVGTHFFRVRGCNGSVCGSTSSAVSVYIEFNPDEDLDGVDDPYDLCPGTLANTQVSAAGCVPTTADSDGDGVTDDLDWCSGSNATSTYVNITGCTLDQIDSDGDGAPDYQDAYPLQGLQYCPAG